MHIITFYQIFWQVGLYLPFALLAVLLFHALNLKINPLIVKTLGKINYNLVNLHKFA
jgi:hypothetical protein